MVPRKLLLVRNDRLGDFLLAWPAFSFLRTALPQTEIEALVPAYTAPLAAICPSIDRVRIEEPDLAGVGDGERFSRALRGCEAEWALVFATRLPLALALWRSGIPHRLAPATKIDQIFYTHRLIQRRSRSVKPEWEYNVDLARHALELWGCPIPELPGPPYLRMDAETVQRSRTGFVERHGIPGHLKLVFLHPGHGGSAENLTPDAYAYLGAGLLQDPGIMLVVTAGPMEEEMARRVVERISRPDRTCLHISREGITRFTEHIAFADLWISGSTGPLHLAGALNRPTVAFYPKRRSARSLRWGTINEEKNRLALQLEEHAEDRVELDRALGLIRDHFLSPSCP
ncbi:ADP-heptose-lipooligosaccharide heptosyltransferase III [mine drainage metagenome]|uniref:ADP-heptose-lipooligosaccharide heptosyltransferase III n=2 Tax=mine drainage metagenome TaxID=410659 RepID=T1AG60_9ZZZZ